MPRKNEPKLTNRKDGRAVVHYKGKMYVMGKSGTKEAKAAYHRFCIELQNNPIACLAKESRSITLTELAVAYLDYAKAMFNKSDYYNIRTIVSDFLLKLYGDNTAIEKFTPPCLKLVRDEMIRSGRFCRKTINKYITHVGSMFSWGVAEGLVQETTHRALKAIKALPEGYPGTFDHEERGHVSDDIVKRTLPHMSPTVAAMVQVQRMTGMRNSEICKMTVGDIDTTSDTEFWYYNLKQHKTKKHVGKKSIPMGKTVQGLISHYIVGKKPENAVFSPRTAMQELKERKRTNRKTKITPSQAARNAARAKNPKQYQEFYNKESYLKAIKHAIKRANKTLPKDQHVPNWFPYQLRHSTATMLTKILGKALVQAQAQLGHTKSKMTENYTKDATLSIMEELARHQQNPFESE